MKHEVEGRRMRGPESVVAGAVLDRAHTGQPPEDEDAATILDACNLEIGDAGWMQRNHEIVGNLPSRRLVAEFHTERSDDGQLFLDVDRGKERADHVRTSPMPKTLVCTRSASTTSSSESSSSIRTT